MTTPITASIQSIDPNTLQLQTFNEADNAVIPNFIVDTTFNQKTDIIEFFVYDANKNLINVNYNYIDWASHNPPVNGVFTSITLDPQKDLINLGLDNGELNTVYNFISNQLGSSISSKYYISEISSDRTELKLQSNFIPNEVIASTFVDFETKFLSASYYDEFYINFTENNYVIGVNAKLDLSITSSYGIYIKLYEPLPAQFDIKSEVYVVSKPAESAGYKVTFENNASTLDTSIYLKGPNYGIQLNDQFNNSTDLMSQKDIETTYSAETLNQIKALTSNQGVELAIDYTDFSEFVNFSSAKQRLINFYQKASSLESYQNDLNALLTITGPTTGSYSYSASVSTLQNKIQDTITNFDGYDYYLYYESSSYAYPKSGSNPLPPYTLLPTGSVQVLTWLGSDVEGSQYYGGRLLSASIYDDKNQENLNFIIPEFIRENSDNENYLTFVNMVGQMFDNVWTYTSAVTEKYNTDNRLDYGLSKDLVEAALTSLGVTYYPSSNNTQDIYTSFLGITPSGSFLPSTGSELITNYIAVNGPSFDSYVNDNYVLANYIFSQITNGFPFPLDDVTKEIYKRIYHNLPYLLKKKGTVAGLRELINIFGIPSTILRINEFGGQNKDFSNDWDLWYDRYSYNFTPNQSASVVVPWLPLERNYIASNQYIVPDTIEFRFKTTGIPTSPYYSQSLLVKKSNNGADENFDFGVFLFYTGSQASSSYSGSIANPYSNYGNVRFYISGSSVDGGYIQSNDIYLPIFDDNWWSVMFQRNTHPNASDYTQTTTYSLYVKNKIYSGWDGNQIGFQGSASLTVIPSQSINNAWNKYGTGAADGVYLGGYISGSKIGSDIITLPNTLFTGSFQEFRYYSTTLSEGAFDNFVMNPESIEGLTLTGVSSSFDVLNFRAPLGNELEYIFSSSLLTLHSTSYYSMHPSSTASAQLLMTNSFVIPSTSSVFPLVYGVSLYGSGDVVGVSNEFKIIYYPSIETKSFTEYQTEVYYPNTPGAGIQNRVTNKIQVITGSLYGNVLSNQRSLEQSYEISESFSRDVNYLEVAFSPQEEINDDIIATLGPNALSNTIADPRVFRNREDRYSNLDALSQDYFKKYTEAYDIKDYTRLIKYFDNALFRMIKNYVPARTGLSTGIVIKSHLLDRSKIPVPILNTYTTLSAIPNTDVRQNLILTSSTAMETFSGGAGGSIDKFNTLTPDYLVTPVTQSWSQSLNTIAGVVSSVNSFQNEFYTGEYSGSELVTTTQSLDSGNTWKYLINPNTNSFAISDYNALYDNATIIRTNTLLMDVDYSTGIFTPVNLDLLISGAADKAPVPDSNYTMTRIINPRYDGSRLSSADFNNYTMAGPVVPVSKTAPQSVSVKNYFLNGDTGSWSGDKSYGKTATVDHYPRYFAHFKYAYQTPELYDSFTYLLDRLIEVPNVDITQDQGFIPQSLKIDGSNQNLYETVGSFEHGRQASVILTAPSSSKGVNFDNIKSKNQPRKPDTSTTQVNTNKIYDIIQGGLEYINIATTELAYAALSPTMSFAGYATQQYNTYVPISPQSTSGLLVTGSNYFILTGSKVLLQFDNAPGYLSTDPPAQAYGPALPLIHTFNQLLYQRQFTTTTTNNFNPGDDVIIGSITLDPTINNNYFRFKNTSSYTYSGTGTVNYSDADVPFLIQKGDELRVTYNGTGSKEVNIYTQDFTVLGIETSTYIFHGTNNASEEWAWFSKLPNQGGIGANPTNSFQNIYDKIKVYPDPATLPFPIPNGSITNFTIRRRVENDSKVILSVVAPPDAKGILTPTSEGYLIPTDFSETQKKNATYILNKLASQNIFGANN